jgi:hypothetical protein
MEGIVTVPGMWQSSGRRSASHAIVFGVPVNARRKTTFTRIPSWGGMPRSLLNFA